MASNERALFCAKQSLFNLLSFKYFLQLAGKCLRTAYRLLRGMFTFLVLFCNNSKTLSMAVTPIVREQNYLKDYN